jgi:primosomal protein N' (replication factor Y)
VTTGYVVGLADKSDVAGLKDVEGLVGEKPYIKPVVLDLARWMAEYYCAPVELAVRTVLPGVVRRRATAFKTGRHVLLDVPRIEAGGGLEQVASQLSAKQAGVLRYLAEHDGVAVSRLTQDLKLSEAPVNSLARKGWVVVKSLSVIRDPLANRNILPSEPLALMPEQAAALRLIERTVDGDVAVELDAADDDAAGEPEPARASRVVLLYGVTGSGKTEVYLQAISHALARGKSAIVLVPEISLTPQTVERFVSRFGQRIAVLHSHLSDGERHDEWHRIRDGEADVVIGARSALFAPVDNLGLIVVDEEHEPSYKQDEAPRYNARDVAVMRGHMEKCAVVLGSATPAMESWFNACIGKYHLATLPRRADDRSMPLMRIVDMRLEAQRTGRGCVFSKELIEALQTRLDRAEQSILFLNRRGFSTSLMCPCCGYVSQCGQCSVAHTYHRTDELLRCHICGDARPVPERCPECRDPQFKYTGIGTQRVESIVSKMFPHARVRRMDADATRRKDAYDEILGDFRTGKIDILIGTQMIAKGLHFPNVTLVGVIYADLSLHMPDFRAAERSYQLLAQVAGRAGRGDVAGEVIVQTFTPFHHAIQCARRLDYEGLCDQELEFRDQLKYPPFTHLVCITLRGPDEAATSGAAAGLIAALAPRLARSVIVSEPAPAPLARAKGLYRYQVMLRSRAVMPVTRALRAVLAETKLPREVACSVDVDALNLL